MGLLKPTVINVCLLLLCFCSIQTTVCARRGPDSMKLNYVVHEIRTGANAKLVTAAGPGSGKWGTILMNDNMVRQSESTSSKLIGGSTGFGAVTSSLGIGGGGGILSIIKVTFNDASASYNGSSLTFTGTVATAFPPYEVIVLGGTGHFRGYRGYALASPGVASPPVYTTKWEVFLWK